LRTHRDSLATDVDARWLFDALKASPMIRDVKIGRATHLMHLEENRYALYREAQTFLEDCDYQPGASLTRRVIKIGSSHNVRRDIHSPA
jgi:hypothetical protein